MKKFVVIAILFIVALATVSFVFASEPEQAPSGVTGICVFEYGVSVDCPEDTTSETIAPRQAWEMTHDISSVRASHPIRFAYEGGSNGGSPS